MKKRTAIEQEDWVDYEWGEIVSCEAVPYSGDWPDNKGTCVPNVNPWQAMCDFRVGYANGMKAELTARGGEILCGEGFRGYILVDEEYVEPQEYLKREPYSPTGYRFFNKMLVATVVKTLADCTYLNGGEVELVDDVEATKILSENSVPPYPALSDDEEDGELRMKWYRKWIDDGVCVDDGDRHGPCVSKMLLDEEISGTGGNSETQKGLLYFEK